MLSKYDSLLFKVTFQPEKPNPRSGKDFHLISKWWFCFGRIWYFAQFACGRPKFINWNRIREVNFELFEITKPIINRKVSDYHRANYQQLEWNNWHLLRIRSPTNPWFPARAPPVLGYNTEISVVSIQRYSWNPRSNRIVSVNSKFVWQNSSSDENIDSSGEKGSSPNFL